MKLIEMQVIGAMRPPDGSSKAMSGRFIRHFNTINVDLVSINFNKISEAPEHGFLHPDQMR